MQPPDPTPLTPSSPSPADRSEFFALYTRHARQLYRYIRLFVPHQNDAEDVFQEVSAVLWEKFDQFQSGTNFSAWATSVARYSVLNLRHRQKHMPIVLSDEFFKTVAQEVTDLGDALDNQQRALADCHRKLKLVDRRLLDARYRLGISVKELAQKVGRPQRSVYRAFERIHTALLNCIERALSKEAGS